MSTRRLWRQRGALAVRLVSKLVELLLRDNSEAAQADRLMQLWLEKRPERPSSEEVN